MMSQRPPLWGYPLGVVTLLLWIGILLLPFSTSTDSSVGVISYGVPVIGSAAALGMIVALLGGLRLSTGQAIPMAAGSALITSIALSWMVAPDPLVSGKRFLVNLIGFALFSIFLAQAGQPEEHERRFFSGTVKATVLSGSLIGVYYLAHATLVIAQYGIGAVALREVGDLMSLRWGASNTIAGILVPIAFLGIYQWHTAQRRRLIWFVCVILMMCTVLLTLSKGANIALGVGLILFFLALRHVRFLLVFATLIVLGFVLYSYYEPPQLNNFIADQVPNAHDFDGRTEIWKASLAEAIEAPLQMRGYYSSLGNFGHSSHNYLLTTMLERGFIGLLLSLTLPVTGLLYALRGSLCPNRKMRYFYLALLCGGIASAIHMQVEDINFTDQFIVLTWIMWGLLFVMQKDGGEGDVAEP
jgi:hypothetical protein